MANIQGRVCRFCKTPLTRGFVDLGMAPLSNAYLRADQLNGMEPFYPLHAYVCEKCLLVQVEELESPQKIFGDYAYFSSFSDSWLKHAERYCEGIVERRRLTGNSKVVELASNDGYLLQYFQKKGIPVLGVEPAENVAKVAIEHGIPTEIKFFGEFTARDLLAKGHAADLMVGNNVLAHVPDINDFIRGIKILLKADGVLTMEFPHLLNLIELNQFDTIYHEHFSYLSILAVEKIFDYHGLTLFDVEQLPTHGGSLRIYVKHKERPAPEIHRRVHQIKDLEMNAGLHRIESYQAYAEQVKKTKWNLLEFLIQAKRNGKKVVGYGAPAKGNTLLNYCGIREDFIDFTVDRNPHKQGHFLPGTHIPIKSPDDIRAAKPDYLFILPWNLRTEIAEQMSYIREWGGKFVVPIPRVEIF